MAEEDAVGGAQRERERGEQLEVQRVHLAAPVAVGDIDALAEDRVEVVVVLHHEAVRRLGEFVVADEVMDLARVLGREGTDDIEELVRLIGAVGVAEGAVDEFLQNEVPARVFRQLGVAEQGAEVFDVAVHVPGDEEFVRVEADEPAGAARFVAERQDGPADRL